MKLETAKKIVAAGQELDGDGDVRLNETYSGRGMYGKTTSAVVLHPSALLQCVALAAARIVQDEHSDDENSEDELTLEAFIDDLARVRTDNMGRDDVVVY